MPSYKNTERNTWYCAFYFTDWQGKRKKKKKEGFKTKREAQEWERKFLEQFANTPDISFEILVNQYQKQAALRLKPMTYYSKSGIIKNHILPYFADMPINKINRRIINEWKNKLLAQDLKPSYMRAINAQLSAIFNYAVDNYNLEDNPCSGLGKLHKANSNINYWTLEEFRKFAMTFTQPHHIMIFYLLFWTGMRIGETLALTWDDINFENNSITINKTFSRLHQKDIITTPKTAKSERIVIMPQFIADMLKDFKRITKYCTERIFDISHYTIRDRLKDHAIMAGLPPIRIHDLRHSHASLLINANFSPIEVADRLGHANASITLKVYSHFYSQKRTTLAEKINNIT